MDPLSSQYFRPSFLPLQGLARVTPTFQMYVTFPGAHPLDNRASVLFFGCDLPNAEFFFPQQAFLNFS